MKFGYFDDRNKEYVITTPQTPLPWINYLGSEDFFSLVSNTVGGYSFYRDARMRRLTRYRYNNSPLDMDGHRIYIKDGDTVWNPGWQPTKTPLDSYSCRHGLGYTVVEGKKDGVTARQELFVPKGDACELDRVTVCNESAAVKELDLFSYVEFCLWDAVDDSSNFQRNYSTGEVEVEGSVIYHKTEYRERRNHYAVFWANCPVDSFDTTRDAFCGVYGGPADPQAVRAGHCSGSIAHGWAPVGALHIHLTLAPGESRSILFGLGYIENPQEEKFIAPGVINKTRAHAMMERYATDAQVDAARAALRTHWEQLLSTYHLESGEEKLNRMVNIWHQYQCMVTFNMSRSASYYESGTGRGMGFRDSCQDLLGFVHIIPSRARERILDIAATQFADGSSYKTENYWKESNLMVTQGQGELQVRTIIYSKDDLIVVDTPFVVEPNRNSRVQIEDARQWLYNINNTYVNGGKVGTFGVQVGAVYDGNTFDSCLGYNHVSQGDGVVWYVSMVNTIYHNGSFWHTSGSTDVTGETTNHAGVGFESRSAGKNGISAIVMRNIELNKGAKIIFINPYRLGFGDFLIDNCSVNDGENAVVFGDNNGAAISFEGLTIAGLSCTDVKTPYAGNYKPLLDQTNDYKSNIITMTYGPAAEDGLLGDVNNDGQVTIMDALIIRQYLIGEVELTDAMKKNADVNNDKVISILDALRIRLSLVGQATLKK